MAPVQFLDLPREIRDHIYYDALIAWQTGRTSRADDVAWRFTFTLILRPDEEDDIDSGDEQLGRIDFPKNKTPGVSLLRTSKQIHAESAPILYGNAMFALSSYRFVFSSDAVPAFMDAIGGSTARLIQHFSFSVHHLWPTRAPTYMGDSEEANKILYERASEHLRSLRTWTGLRTLEITSSPPNSGWMHSASIRKGMDVIHRELVSVLPNLQRVTLVMVGTRKLLCDSERLPLVRQAKRLGWVVRRRHSRWMKMDEGQCVKQIEIDDDFDPDGDAVAVEA